MRLLLAILLAGLLLVNAEAGNTLYVSMFYPRIMTETCMNSLRIVKISILRSMTCIYFFKLMTDGKVTVTILHDF